jgi:aminoglycoside phosphotransferase
MTVVTQTVFVCRGLVFTSQDKANEYEALQQERAKLSMARAKLGVAYRLALKENADMDYVVWEKLVKLSNSSISETDLK